MGDEDPKKPEPEPAGAGAGAGSSSALAKTPEEFDPIKEQTFFNPFTQQVPDPAVQKSSGDFVDKEAVLSQLIKEKSLALIKAWEEHEKARAETKAYKRLSAVGSWENSKKAVVEVQLNRFEEKWLKKKAKYEERMKNKIAEIHREAEEKRAMTEANRCEDFVDVEETAEKFRASGFIPRKFLSCFS